MNIVGKGFSVEEFRTYVDGLKFNGWTPNFVVVHNTSSPDLKLYLQWLQRKNWTGEQWMKNLAAYYSGMGWSAGPHLFVAPDRIWTLSPLTARGTHSPAWNSFTWGVETVGEFEREKFDGGSHDNLVGALAVLHSRIGLNPADYKKGVRGLHYHKEDPKTTHKTCPGKNMKKPELVADVVAAMQGAAPGGHVHVSEAAATADTSSLPAGNLSPEWVQAALNSWFKGKVNWQAVKVPPAKLSKDVVTRVKVLQTSGWQDLAVDGDLGTKSKAAVAILQATTGGMVVDGIAGPLTRLALHG